MHGGADKQPLPISVVKVHSLWKPVAVCLVTLRELCCHPLLACLDKLLLCCHVGRKVHLGLLEAETIYPGLRCYFVAANQKRNHGMERVSIASKLSTHVITIKISYVF